MLFTVTQIGRINIFVSISICLILYWLHYRLIILRYAKKIEVAIQKNDKDKARKMLVYALKKQPYKRVFRQLQKKYKDVFDS